MPFPRLIGGLLVGLCATAAPGFADCEHSGITRAIGIEEAWVENAVYFFGEGRASVGPETDLALASRLGMEIDFPGINPATGRLSSTGGAGLKLPVVKRCREGAQSTFLTLELEGQYTTVNEAVTRPPGDSVTVQAAWALADSAGFFEGEAGHVAALGPAALGGWFANASLGHRFGPFAAQVEGEIDDEASRGRRTEVGGEGSVFPQVAFHAGQAWLLAVGEERHFGPLTPRWTTWLMAEREFD